MDEKLIMAVIANKNDDLKYKKQQIELFFSVHSDAAERAQYLQSAYQDRYTEILVDGARVGYKPQENGLLMWEGAYLSRTKESVFSWDIIVAWTAQLIDKKEYFINTDIAGLKNQNSQQMSLFDFDSFNSSVPLEGSQQTTLFPRAELSQQIIDEALCIGANDRYSRLIICAYFMKDKDDNAQFLQEHYGENGAGLYFDDRKVSIWYNAEGIRIAEGESANRSSATLVTWEQAAKRIRELLDLGRYMPQSELDKVSDYEVNQLADRLLLMYRDIEDEGKKHLSTLQAIYEAPGGFPEMDKALAALLKEPESLQTIVTEYKEFAEAYKANPKIMRFRYYRPLELGEELTDLQREPLIFTAAENYNPQRRFFISTDEIDEILRGGKSSTDYRLAVYSFYRNHTDRKEREDFLKNYHGEYSGSSGGNDDLLYQKGKGISFSHGTIGEPYAKVELKWNQVEKRVSSLISSGKFLSEDDRAAMPQYEKQQLAREIQTFFSDVPQEQPRPFPYGFDYWDAVKLIETQLDEPQKVEEIYQMMLPVWEATPQDDPYYEWRKTAFESLAAYRNGTYTLFGEAKTPLSIEAPIPPEQVLPRESTPEQIQRQQVADRLEDLGYVVSDETLDVGFSEYAARGGLGNYEDVADFIENEFLSDEGEPDLSDIMEELPAKEEQAVLAPPKPKRERVVFTTLHPEIPSEQRHNFHISDKELGYGTPGEKFAANAAAIRCLKQVEYENRLATPDEQITLSRYVGWGGLADCFDDRNSHYQELKSLLGTEEYAAARESTLTAFYTSPVITNAIYQALSQMGFQTGNLLEPACGVGNFIGSIPENMNCKAYGVELDSISGRIAQQLYQNSSISVNGFEKVQMPDSFFDVAIGNVPFGDFKVLDRKYDKHHWLIHDYFFGKALDKVRPGGIVAFITSKGTMDKDNSAVRKYLAQRADLVGAIRLPDNAFKRNAGTEVTSDIIFLQKRDHIVDIEPDWVHLGTDENGIKMNSYFVQHPEMVLGEMKIKRSLFLNSISLLIGLTSILLLYSLLIKFYVFSVEPLTNILSNSTIYNINQTK